MSSLPDTAPVDYLRILQQQMSEVVESALYHKLYKMVAFKKKVGPARRNHDDSDSKKRCVLARTW